MKTFLVIDRLRAYYKVDTNAKLAKKLGVSPSAIANWKVRNRIDWMLIFTRCEDVNLNWLIHGEGPMMKESAYKVSEDKDVNKMLLDRVEELTIEKNELQKELENIKAEKKTKKSVSYDVAAEPDIKRRKK